MCLQSCPGCAAMLLGLDLLQAIHCSLKSCEVQLALSCQACLQAVSGRKQQHQRGPWNAAQSEPPWVPAGCH